MLAVHHSAVQPNFHGGAGLVQLALIRLCGDYVFHGRPGECLGNQRAHQQPRNRSVAVRKMKNVGLFFLRRRKPESLKAGIGERLIIVTGLEAIHCRNRFDTDTPEIV